MMHDCDDGVIRDLLPDYLHGSLEPELRAQVESHLAHCAVCAEELGFLRTARSSFETPQLDIRAIVRASQQVRVVRDEPVVTALWGRSRWRIAAAVSFLLVGTVSVQLLRQQYGSDRAAAPMLDSAIAALPGAGAGLVVPGDSPKLGGAVAESSVAKARKASPGLEMGGALSDLTEDQLRALLETIDGADAVPSAEPEARLTPLMAPAGRTGRIGGTQ